MNPEREDLREPKAIRYQLSDKELNIPLSKDTHWKNKKLYLQHVFLTPLDLYFIANGFPKINLEHPTDESGERWVMAVKINLSLLLALNSREKPEYLEVYTGWATKK